MSHFSSVQTQLIDRQALVKGLEDVFEKNHLAINLEVYDTPVELMSDYSSSDSSEVEIIIRRHQLKHNDRDALLDVGFAWNQEQQHFSAIVDSWDFDQNLLGHHFNTVQQFLDQVQLAHDMAYINLHYPADLWNHQVTQLEDGTIRTTLTQKTSLVETSLV